MKVLRTYNNLPKPLKATFWFTVCMFLQKAFSMITVPVFTRLMNTEQYGEFSVFLSVFGVLVVVMTLNINGILATRGLSKFKGKENVFVSNIQFLGTISVILNAVLCILFLKQAKAVTGLNEVEIYCMLGAIFVTPAFEIWTAWKRCDYDYHSILAITVIFLLLNTGTSIIAVIMSEEKGQARIASYCVIQILLYGVLYAINMRGFSLNKEMIIYALKFNVPLIPQGLANQVLARSDVFMIQLMMNQSMAGIYSLGYSVANLVAVLTTSVAYTYFPWLYKKLDNKDYRSIRKVSNGAILFIFSCVSSLMFIAPEIISIFAPSSYGVAVYIVPPAAAGIGFTSVYTFFVSLEMYCEKTTVIMIGSVGVALVNIVLNTIFIPIYGIVAPAYTTLISYLGYCVVHYFLAKKCCGKTLEVNKVYDVRFMMVASVVLLLVMIIAASLYTALVIRYIIFVSLVGFAVVLGIKNKNFLKLKI